MNRLKQTGGLIAIEYGLLFIAILSSLIFGVKLFEGTFDVLLKAINDEIVLITVDLTTGTTSTTDAVTITETATTEELVGDTSGGDFVVDGGSSDTTEIISDGGTAVIDGSNEGTAVIEGSSSGATETTIDGGGDEGIVIGE